ncbi:MAG: LD-carboxypeptidase [Cyanobacteria bacterium P01_H01_bin.74]
MPASTAQTCIKPKALQPGDTIAIVSPAAHTPPNADGSNPFEQAVALIETHGYRAKLMPNAQQAHLFLGGTDEQRLADLHAAFADDSIQAVFCARGGYGCTRLLNALDFDLIAKNPKILVGFSDITALLLPIYQKIGLVGFYAPMLTSNLIQGEPFSEAELMRQVNGSLRAIGKETPFTIPNMDTYHCLSPGQAEGKLMGGNLSLLTALCGTPFQVNARDHILFIEDWQEAYYALDRKFQQLKMAGVFDGVKAVLLCDFSEIQAIPGVSLPEFLDWVTKPLGIPVGYGFSVGHGEQTATIPIGVKGQLNTNTGELRLLEAGVC